MSMFDFVGGFIGSNSKVTQEKWKHEKKLKKAANEARIQQGVISAQGLLDKLTTARGIMPLDVHTTILTIMDHLKVARPESESLRYLEKWIALTTKMAPDHVITEDENLELSKDLQTYIHSLSWRY